MAMSAEIGPQSAQHTLASKYNAEAHTSVHLNETTSGEKPKL